MILHGCTYTDCRYTYNIQLIYLNIMIHMYRYVYIYIFLHTNSPLYPCIWILREQRELHMPARQRELRARAKIVLAELEEALLGVLFGSCVPWVKLQV